MRLPLGWEAWKFMRGSTDSSAVVRGFDEHWEVMDVNVMECSGDSGFDVESILVGGNLEEIESGRFEFVGDDLASVWLGSEVEDS